MHGEEARRQIAAAGVEAGAAAGDQQSRNGAAAVEGADDRRQRLDRTRFEPPEPVAGGRIEQRLEIVEQQQDRLAAVGIAARTL